MFLDTSPAAAGCCARPSWKRCFVTLTAGAQFMLPGRVSHVHVCEIVTLCAGEPPMMQQFASPGGLALSAPIPLTDAEVSHIRSDSKRPYSMRVCIPPSATFPGAELCCYADSEEHRKSFAVAVSAASVATSAADMITVWGKRLQLTGGSGVLVSPGMRSPASRNSGRVTPAAIPMLLPADGSSTPIATPVAPITAQATPAVPVSAASEGQQQQASSVGGGADVGDDATATAIAMPASVTVVERIDAAVARVEELHEYAAVAVQGACTVITVASDIVKTTFRHADAVDRVISTTSFVSDVAGDLGLAFTEIAKHAPFVGPVFVALKGAFELYKVRDMCPSRVS